MVSQGEINMFKWYSIHLLKEEYIELKNELMILERADSIKSSDRIVELRIILRDLEDSIQKLEGLKK